MGNDIITLSFNKIVFKSGSECLAKIITEVEEYIFKHKEVKIREIIDVFELSESTVRRYIKQLIKNGSIKKEYGFVVANVADNLVNIKARIGYLSEKKVMIAQLAESFITDGDTIFVDSGTTHMYLAEALSSKKDITIVTNNLLFAIKIVDSDTKANLIIVPGIVNKKTISSSGDSTIRYIDEFYFDIAFITASGVSIENGPSNRTLPECDIKRKIISRSKLNILLVDDSKFDKIFPFSFATLDSFDYILTNKKPEDKFLEFVKKKKTNIKWS